MLAMNSKESVQFPFQKSIKLISQNSQARAVDFVKVPGQKLVMTSFDRKHCVAIVLRHSELTT